MRKLERELTVHLDGDRTELAKSPHYELFNSKLSLHDLGNRIRSGKDVIISEAFEAGYLVDDSYGDEMILSVKIPLDTENIHKVYEFILELTKKYYEHVGQTISAGIGDSLNDSKLGLKRAKERLSDDYIKKLSKGEIVEKICCVEFGSSLQFYYSALKDLEENRVDPDKVGPVLIYFYSILKNGNNSGSHK